MTDCMQNDAYENGDLRKKNSTKQTYSPIISIDYSLWPIPITVRLSAVGYHVGVCETRFGGRLEFRWIEGTGATYINFTINFTASVALSDRLIWGCWYSAPSPIFQFKGWAVLLF